MTNWDQGGLPLQHVVEAIQFLGARFDIVGADSCGDFAPIRHSNPFKRVEAALDQPRIYADAASEINSAANDRLISAFEGLA